MEIIENLYKSHQIYLSNTRSSFERIHTLDIHWESRLIGIKGAKGVGKTTAILQHIKKNFSVNERKALYITMDNISLRGSTIKDIAEAHVNNGGSHLFIDEIHKYPDWAIELKNIYDLYPQLSIVFTGSSILQIHSQSADLSRRAIMYEMNGLSLREFIEFQNGFKITPILLNELLSNHIEIASEISNTIKVIPLLNDYLQFGYYPFYMEGVKVYNQKLDQIINNILEVDLPYVYTESMQSIFKIKKLLHLLAISVPYEPNITKLAGSLEIHRNKVIEFLYYLHEAKLITVLQEAGKSYGALSKPEKIYLQNTNLQYALCSDSINKGNVRECFFLNQTSTKHKVHVAKMGGDFLLDEKYIFEVGGAKKGFKQIANNENSYVVADDLITGVPNKIPMWLFGFLY